MSRRGSEKPVGGLEAFAPSERTKGKVQNAATKAATKFGVTQGAKRTALEVLKRQLPKFIVRGIGVPFDILWPTTLDDPDLMPDDAELRARLWTQQGKSASMWEQTAGENGLSQVEKEVLEILRRDELAKEKERAASRQQTRRTAESREPLEASSISTDDDAAEANDDEGEEEENVGVGGDDDVESE